jgi:DNA-binding NarL/FixJ family response regulator
MEKAMSLGGGTRERPEGCSPPNGEMSWRCPVRLHLLEYGLTRRQVDVVLLAACELTNREIAVQLGIEERTVKGHLTRIYDRLGIERRIELVLFLSRIESAGEDRDNSRVSIPK